jgi:dolichol-phosphate mannosyltransferase
LPIKLIKRPGKLGLGSAYISGFGLALQTGAELILEMDADLSHDPHDLPRLIATAAEADLVIGSRKIPGGDVVGWSPARKFMSAGAMFFSRALLRLKAKDVTAGFRCFRRQVLESIKLSEIKSNGYAFQEELLYRTQRAGFRIKEIPVIFIDRQTGKSKLSKKDIWEFFAVMIKLLFSKI